MKDVLKRVDKEEDEHQLQGSLDLGYETSYHNSGLDLTDESTGQNGHTPGKLELDINGNAAPPDYTAADFETAISSTGFGKFQYVLLIAIVPASMSAIFGTSSMSFILPVATCEFGLSSFQKGLLNGAIYSGMITSGFLWGFVSDVMGRQKPLYLGLLADGIAAFCLSCSQSFEYLVLFKFLAGVAICGPFSLTYAYLSEFFDKSRRDSIVMMTGCFTSFGSLLQPMIAYFIIPNKWEFYFFGDTFLINSWRIFLMISTLPSLSGALLVYFMPETPKFLMTHGRTEEALKVFQCMYAWNTGNSRESYPIKRLQSGSAHAGKKTFAQSVAQGWRQVNPLFRKPYLKTALIIFFLQALTMASLNTVRLLQPQIFASYLSATGNDDLNVCETIDRPPVSTSPQPANKTSLMPLHHHYGHYYTISKRCAKPGVIDDRVYSNASFVGACTFFYYILANFLMKVLGKKKLYVASVLLCGVCIGIYPWSYSIYVVIQACFFMAVMSTTVTVVLGCCVQQFPTTLRALAVNMTMISGRLGVLVGSLLFSVFVERTCQWSFLFLAGVNVVSAFVMTFCLTERTAEDGDVTADKVPPSHSSLDPLSDMRMVVTGLSVEQLTEDDLREAKLDLEEKPNTDTRV
uniref:Synaptic vesicle glycoprotein 2B n=1 Tax=Cacopsylla melanoneura TaxID=428564 RepID=A0A8D8S1F2_9HEMI